MKRFIATVQLVLEEESELEASETVTAWFTDFLQQQEGGPLDWGFVSIGHQYLYPSEYNGDLPMEA